MSESRASKAKRSAATRPPPSPPPRSSRRPRASSASRRATPCSSPSGSTKASISAARPVASSPICEPTACRSRRKPISAVRRVVDQALWRSLRAGLAAPLPGQGQERAGGARGHPADRLRQAAGRRRPLSRGRRSPALQADLDSARWRARWPRAPRSSAPPPRSTSPARTASLTACAPPVRSIRFDGFLKLYEEGRDDDADERRRRACPRSPQATRSTTRGIDAEQHFTEPPPRYTEATLIKKMEELGIGRPSTYASTLTCCATAAMSGSTRSGSSPEDKGRLVTAFLESFFSRYVEYDFTADLEEKLDRISAGELDWKDVLRDFWREFIGRGRRDRAICAITAGARRAERAARAAHLPRPRATAPIPRPARPAASGGSSLKLGKFGAFIGCSNYPECRFTRQLADADGDEGRLSPRRQVLGADPETGLDVTPAHRPLRSLCPARRAERQGEAETRFDPRRAPTRRASNSTRRSRCSRCRARWACIPETGKPIVAGFGRYGPYVQHDGKYASLGGRRGGVRGRPQPRGDAAGREGRLSRGHRAGPSVIKELGEHPELGGKVQDLDAAATGLTSSMARSMPRLPGTASPSRSRWKQAVELIAARAAKGPVKKKPAQEAAHARAQRAKQRGRRRRRPG